MLQTKGGEIPRAQLGAPKEVRETLKLRRGDVWRNLAVLVALPWAKRKLDESYDIHAASVNVLGPAYAGRDAWPADGTVKQRLMWLYKWFLREVYPGVNAAYYFSMLLFNLAYLFDGSKYSSPFLWLIGTRIRRMNAADHMAMELAGAEAPRTSGSRPGQSTSLFSPRTMKHLVYPRLLSSLKILLPTSIFALKFLEWWHASDFARQLSRKANEGLELPPPIVSGLPTAKSLDPNTSKSNNQSTSEKTDNATSQKASTTTITSPPPISSLTHLPILTVPPPFTRTCPICASPIQTPTACQTGYVYCYTCIYKWLDGSHPRQLAFMEGAVDEEGRGWVEEGGGSREGKWESGAGRCAITGRRVLGGTGGLRRVVV